MREKTEKPEDMSGFLHKYHLGKIQQTADKGVPGGHEEHIAPPGKQPHFPNPEPNHPFRLCHEWVAEAIQAVLTAEILSAGK